MQNLTLLDHLTELRSRLVKSLLAIVAFSFLAYAYSEQVFDVIRKPIAPYLSGGGLIFTAPTDKFMAHIKVAMFAGLILSCPVWIYQAYKFIAPGLYKNEKKYVVSFIFTGSMLFLVGILFSYFGMMPIAFEFLLGFGGSTDKPMITINEYLSLFMTLALVFGLAFELPLVLVILGMLGIVSKEFLQTKRRYAVVILAVVSAILTPPDIVSMCLMLIPLCFLYEVSIIAVGILGKKENLAS